MPQPAPRKLASLGSTDRFLAEISSPATIRPGYVLLGDETFLLDRCRRAVLATLAPEPTRDFTLHDLDLADVSLFEALDRAQTPSLMAPFQVLFLRNLKVLYTRGSKKEEFAAIDQYFRSPNPQAVLLFVADHIHLPTDLRRMDMQDRDRYDRIRETLGDLCSIVELARFTEEDAIRWSIDTALDRKTRFDPDAARELVDALGGDMMLIASELEKLLLYVTAPAHLRIPHTAALASETRPQPPAPTITDSAPPSLAPEISHQSQTPAEDPNAPSLPRETFDQPATPPLPSSTARITLGDVETMVLAAKQRTLYELTDAISLRDRPRAVALLHGLLNASDSGDDAAIGHLYMLARTFRQMLIILERNVRDSRAIWQVLWQGFRMPPFAADDLIRQARRYPSRRDLTRALRLIARADLDLRSSPVSKRLVLERLVVDLSTAPTTPRYDASPQFAMEL